MESDRKFGVTISVLTYNRCNLLRRMLLSLQGLKYEALEIIVIDNHSEDNTKEMVAEEFPHIKYFRTEKNVGASARNLGLRHAMGDIVITLDDDIIGIDDNDLPNLISVFRSRLTLGAVNFKVLDHSTGNICNWVHHCKPEEFSHKEFLTYELTEGAVAFRKKALEKAGYYPEYFFLSHEGPDLALRIINSGYEVIYSNKVSVVHYSSNFGREPWLNYYFDTRNQLWLAARNFPVSYTITYLSRGLLSMFAYSIRDGYLLYWMKGLIDGLKGLKRALKDRNVLCDEKLRIIRSIDSHRPNIAYLIKKRLLKRGVRNL